MFDFLVYSDSKNYPEYLSPIIIRELKYNQIMLKTIFENFYSREHDACAYDLLIFNNEKISKDLKEILVSFLTVSAFIDQTVYFVLVDTRLNTNCINDINLYEKYDEIFQFYKFWNYNWPTQMSPEKFIFFRNLDQSDFSYSYSLPIMKKILWDEGVKQFFIHEGRFDVLTKIEFEMRNDILSTHRFSEQNREFFMSKLMEN